MVGHNGAGKSTIIKLLLRLYDPNSGEILLNGRNIKEYNLRAYRNLFYAAFQDYQILALSVKDNVLMGRTFEHPEQVARDALTKTGIIDKIDSLPQGMDTILEAAEFGYPFRDVARFLIILFSLLVISMIFNSFMWQRWRPKGTARILQKLKLQLYDRAKQMDLECYDNPDYYNEFVLSISEAENQVERMMNFLSQLFGGITVFVTTSAYFLLKDSASVIFVFISFIGTFIFSQKLNRLNYKIRMDRIH